jgi:hypothetical protein
MSETSISVKDEIARINALKKSAAADLHSVLSGSSARPPVHQAPPRIQSIYEDHRTPEKPVRDDSCDHTYSYFSAHSDSEDSTTSQSSGRAKKDDIYTVVSDDLSLHIITEIDAGRFISNTPCAPWGRGQKHHPNHSETFKVRRHLSSAGPQTRDQIQASLPATPARLLRAILHELREQGLVTVKRPNK